MIQILVYYYVFRQNGKDAQHIVNGKMDAQYIQKDKKYEY